jgi:hypothetical protein
MTIQLLDKLQKMVHSKTANDIKTSTNNAVGFFKKTIGNTYNAIVHSSENKWVLNQIDKGGAILNNNTKGKILTMHVPPIEKMIGRLFFYIYDPKHKDTLPYYDTFPLVIPIEPKKGGFLGINFHYLPVMYRAKLMDILLSVHKTMEHTKLGEAEYLRITYPFLVSHCKSKKYYKPMIKHYLYSHIRSPFAYIHPDAWENVIFLPVQQFKKSSVNTVWADSYNAIK